MPADSCPPGLQRCRDRHRGLQVSLSSYRCAIRALLGLAANTARVVRDEGTEEDIPLQEVKVGDRLRVRPGEKVPVETPDGTILLKIIKIG